MKYSLIHWANANAKIEPIFIRSNTSTMISGLVEVIKGMPVNHLTVLLSNESKFMEKLDSFLDKLNNESIAVSLFFDTEIYVKAIESRMKLFVETTSLIFTNSFPEDKVEMILEQKLAHRLNLFMFYWGATKYLQNYDTLALNEPIKVVYVIRPKKHIFRIYYNQARPVNDGKILKYNSYDSNTNTFLKIPVLPAASEVYKDFQQRTIKIPVLHTPPWHFVSYNGTSANNDSDDYQEICNLKVTGGRDFNLIKLISQKMNFNIIYCDPPERTQGTIVGSKDNFTFSGGIGMVQKLQGDLFLGDISITLERSQAVEFSFFTLADAAGFVTHAPRYLNEALALVRPFRFNVWPPLIITIILTGPILYFIISTPYKWETLRETPPFHHIEYIKEMSYGLRRRKVEKVDQYLTNEPPELLDKCIWYTINIYLRQSIDLPCNQKSARAKFVSILLWLCATYVLGDVYSAQLTSQLARPAKEVPIDNLERLENAMENYGYQLLVEKDSAFYAFLTNSTGIFSRLYQLMLRQSPNNETYLVQSVEQGFRHILNGNQKAILGGRETLYFNMKKRGSHNFQLSEKLYTRYSAVAVQNGCPFLESLNDVIIRLFEAGILEKITNAEYEKMFGSMEGKTPSEGSEKGLSSEIAAKTESNDTLQPMNLRMFQGAFLVICFGHAFGGLLLILEIKSIFLKRLLKKVIVFRN